ncbi:MAG: FHA domain-containing protein [Oscillospiraceae bacterium]|jgi:hypothetical protein|nr:FHA domain-containing protein [Oscillospiraceae bacterium]
MFAKRLLIMLFALAAASTPAYVGFAAGELSQADAWERNLDVYITEGMDSGSVVCKVSNQAAEVVESGFLADMGVAVRTTLLVDISTSIPSKARGNVKAYIDSLIESIGENEQYKIVAFGEHMSVLHDFSSDRYDLAGAAEKIAFDGNQSRIYDAVFNTIPAIGPIDAAPCYYRTIVITDGVDDTASGVTKEELFLKLQSETYPIDVISVSSSPQSESNKDLAALTRISGGRYVNLNAESDVSALRTTLSADGIFWLRAAVPGALLDGSTRQVDISDGSNSVRFDVKFPVFDVPVTTTPVGDAFPSETTSDIEPPERDAPEPTPEDDDEDEGAEEGDVETPEAPRFALGNIPTTALIGTGAAVVIIAAAVTAILIILKKKKAVPVRRSPGAGGPVGTGLSSAGMTEFVFSPHTDDIGGAGISVRLYNQKNTAQIWNVNLTSGAVIGRDPDCHVHIADSSVSRRQCRLYMDASASVENLSNSNITRLNGKPLGAPSPIRAGDELKFGRVTLIVDSLYSSDAHDSGSQNKGTIFINL